MLLDSEVSAPGTGRRLVVFGRIALAALWLAWAATAWWSAPRAASVAQLQSDLAEGRIVSYYRAVEWQRQRLWAAPAQLRHGQDGGLITWVTLYGQTFYATPDFVHSPAEPAFSMGGTVDRENSETALVETRLRLAGIAEGTTSPVSGVNNVLAIVLVVVSLGILLMDPAPVRGTRWFWFWVGQVPMGLGILAWLAFERPWSASAKEPRGGRRSGLVGLAVMFVCGFLLGLLAFQAHRLLGPGIVPYQ